MLHHQKLVGRQPNQAALLRTAALAPEPHRLHQQQAQLCFQWRSVGQRRFIDLGRTAEDDPLPTKPEPAEPDPPTKQVPKRRRPPSPLSHQQHEPTAKPATEPQLALF